MRRLSSFLRRFHSDERGAFLAMFGLLAIVLIATAGAVVDYTSVQQARTRAQVALDAAALALQPMIDDDEWTTQMIEDAAEALMIERIGDSSIVASITSTVPDPANGTLTLTATLNVPMNFVSLVGVDDMDVGIRAAAARGSNDIEVAIALDITQSMSGSKITALRAATSELIDLVVKDTQTPTYSKMALVPYSNAVNLGSTMAPLARGPYTDYTAITGASWLAGGFSQLTISAITKANPARITTSTNHGLANGATISISNVAGGSGTTTFTWLNGKAFTITVVNATQFTIAYNGTNVNSSSWGGSYTANSGRVNITTGSGRMISTISKQNPARLVTTVPHGLATNDYIYVTNVACTSCSSGTSFTYLNSKVLRVNVISTTEFSITYNGSNVNSTSWSGTYTLGTGRMQKCITGECEIVITSANHGLNNGDVAYITNVGGMTQINQIPFEVSERTADTYVLENSNGAAASPYTSGGRSYCTRHGCYYHYFTRANGGGATNPPWAISTCVTERVTAFQYTNEAPGDGQWVGRHYPPPNGGLGACPGTQIVPLTSDKDILHGVASTLTVAGSTAGQIGLAWAWYALSTTFNSVWADDREPGDPEDNADLVKVLILMTDGAFNTAYCNGVTSRDYNYSTWGNTDAINCDATNGDPFDQAEELCTSIKNGPDGEEGGGDDIILYTVAFDLGNDDDAIELMSECASDPDKAYTPEDGGDLSADFAEIGQNISALRLIN
jgi:Flp pilus assembly protein TadG